MTSLLADEALLFVLTVAPLGVVLVVWLIATWRVE